MKLDRSAFIYLDPQGKDKKQFAQCKTCLMFDSAKSECSILKEKKVHAGGSCTLYVPKPHYSLTYEEVGYIKDQVRCENCKFLFKDSICMLFVKLNKLQPSVWGLDEKVDALGCCNSWHKITKGPGKYGT